MEPRTERRTQRLPDDHPAVQLIKDQRAYIRLLETAVDAARDQSDCALYAALDALDAHQARRAPGMTGAERRPSPSG